MWIIFLAIIPVTISQVEITFYLHQNWITFPGQIPIGTVLFILFGSIGIWSTHTMTTLGDGTPLPSEHTNKLVITGPYKYIRNPMALCGTLQAVSIGIAIGSPFVVAYGALGAFAWNILVRPTEEHQLLTSFGDEYRNYQTLVKCWIPHLKSPGNWSQLLPKSTIFTEDLKSSPLGKINCGFNEVSK
jgi:protein-S-isoprenylcysteine O-methyltransferase Ste14